MSGQHFFARGEQNIYSNLKPTEMQNSQMSQHVGRPNHETGHSRDKDSSSTFSGSYSFLFASRPSSSERGDGEQSSKTDLSEHAHPYQRDMKQDRSHLPDVDISLLGELLATVLDRCSRRCSDANEQIAMMQAQNEAQRAEIKGLTERLERLEALRLPSPLSPQFHVDRRPRAPPSMQHMRPMRVDEQDTDAAIIEDGRLISMRGGQRAKELWTMRRADSAHENHPPPRRQAADQPLPPDHLPAQRMRRAGSPKPIPIRRTVTSPLDAPPLPVRPEILSRACTPRG